MGLIMKINHRDLSELYQSYISRKQPISRKDCPGMPDLIKFFKARTSRRFKTRIIDHMTQCASCANEFDLIRTVMKASEEMDREITSWLEAVRRSQKTSDHSSNKLHFLEHVWKYPAAAIGIISLLLSLSLLFQKNSQFLIKATNGRGDSGSEILLIEPVYHKVVKSHLVFLWKEYDGATSYSLDLLDESLRSIWKSPKLKETQCRLPSQILQKLAPKNTYFWMITVIMKNGSVIESPLANFLLSK